MNAKGIKEEPYNEELKKSDIEQFKDRLEEVCRYIQESSVAG